MPVNMGEKQLNLSAFKRPSGSEIRLASQRKGLTPSGAHWALRVETTILVVMKVKDENEEEKEKKAHRNAGC